MHIVSTLFFFLLIGLVCPLTQAESESPLVAEPRSNHVQQTWWKQQYTDQVETLKNNTCGVLFLGDSITDFWRKEGKKVWEDTLGAYHPVNFGCSGDITNNLLWRIVDSGLPARTAPQLCVVMIGTNNTGLFKCRQQSDVTAVGIVNIVNHLLVKFPDTHVLLLGIFPRGKNAQDPCNVHNMKINKILAETKLPRTTYLNINKQFTDDKGDLKPGITHDHLHLTEKGYRIWANAMMPYIKKYCK